MSPVRIRPPLHGRDHRPGGSDPLYPGEWHYVGEAGEPAFQNSWANDTSDPENTPLRFRWQVSRTIEIEGDITGGSVETVIFTLPDGYRRDFTIRLVAVDSSNNVLVLLVEPSGDVSFLGAAAGPVGPAGGPGGPGPTGATGPQGATGSPAGATGPIGATGATGATGPTGAGTTGATGPTGPQGATGSPAGATGATGPQGDPGDPGGATGATGATGPIGPTGATGPAGVDGTNGSDGAPGATGATGSGATGPTGPAGAGATGATGPAGATGATGATGPPGSGGGDSFQFTFDDSSTADSDPGSGKVKFDNATYSSITKVFIDLLDCNATDVTAWLDSFDDPGGTINGYLKLFSLADQTKWVVFKITTVTTASGYRKLNVTYVSSNGALSTTACDTMVAYAPAGTPGTTGATGATGTTGATGATGPIGATGPVGATGATGVGATGATGSAGGAGSVGATGATGPEGTLFYYIHTR